jgi:hypothetical protein
MRRHWGPKLARALLGVLALSLIASFAVVGWALFAPATPGAATTHSPNSSSGALGPLTTYLLPEAERLSFEGRVSERLVAGSYLYLSVERADGTRTWVVTLASFSPRLDSRVRVVAVGYAAHFNSKRLARTFEGLYFAVVRSV